MRTDVDAWIGDAHSVHMHLEVQAVVDKEHVVQGAAGFENVVDLYVYVKVVYA